MTPCRSVALGLAVFVATALAILAHWATIAARPLA